MGGVRVLNVLSLGLGRQSCGLLLKSLKGEINYRIDHAVFCDLHDEPEEVYQYLDYFQELLMYYYDFPLVVIKDGNNLRADLQKFLRGELKRVGMIPAFVKKANGEVSKLMRQCTYEYKISKVRQWITANRNGQKVDMSFGIPLDEKERGAKVMKQQRPKYMTYSMPLITEGIFTWDILNDFDRWGIRRPHKSSCIYCPFHSDAYWMRLKETSPKDFAKACEVDEFIRDWPGIEGVLFLHRSCIPLREMDFEWLQKNQLDLFFTPNGECTSGVCGT